MEVVDEFKEELHGLYNSKLPVSRAKIGAVTKLAMKSIKHYKHVVMIVEKFIAKSSAPYKLPALYVIDSIVRQSRHQFNETKEVYGPRFGKRLDKIMPMIHQCTEDDKSKVTRVLNLWQKNSVFPPEILQPLLDEAQPPPTSSPQEQPSSTQPVLADGADKKDNKVKTESATNNISVQPQDQIDTVLREQQDQLQNLLNSASSGSEQSGMLVALIDKAKQLQDLQSLQQEVMKGSGDNGGGGRGGKGNGEKSKMSQQSVVANEFSKALLDNFDYSSDEDTDTKLPAPASISNDNNDAYAIIDQLEEQFKREREQGQNTKPPRVSRFHQPSPPPQPAPPTQLITPLSATNTTSLPSPPPPPPPPLPSSHDFDWLPPDVRHSPSLRPPPHLPPPPPLPPSHFPPIPPPHLPHLPPPPHHHHPPRMQNWREDRDWPPPSYHPPLSSIPHQYSRSPPNRRGHAPSPPTDRPYHRERSPIHHYDRGRRRSDQSRYHGDERDHDRSHDDYQSSHYREREGRQRERDSRYHDDDRDRPSRDRSHRSRRSSSSTKAGYVTVKSKTVWIGHIMKGVDEEQLSKMLERYGAVTSIDFIVARGCAYVVMETRDAAAKVVDQLRDPKILGPKCKVAWAPGRGAKGHEFDPSWDVSTGVSNISWDNVKTKSQVEALGNGGVVDTGTLPPQLHEEEITEVEMES